jgi:hypothetical protein
MDSVGRAREVTELAIRNGRPVAMGCLSESWTTNPSLPIDPTTRKVISEHTIRGVDSSARAQVPSHEWIRSVD